MKKLFFIAVILFVGLTCFSQGNEKQYIYCELIGEQNLGGNKMNIRIDYGQLKLENFKNENGKARTFNSMVDALNFMGTLGWEFVQAYDAPEGNSQSMYHWLLKKTAGSGGLEQLKQLTTKN